MTGGNTNQKIKKTENPPIIIKENIVIIIEERVKVGVLITIIEENYIITKINMKINDIKNTINTMNIKLIIAVRSVEVSIQDILGLPQILPKLNQGSKNLDLNQISIKN